MINTSNPLFQNGKSTNLNIFLQNIIYKFRYTILAAIHLIIFSFFFENGIYGDDFVWFLNAREGIKLPILQHIFAYEPYDYFRPFVVFIFRIIYYFFEGKIFIYHFLITIIFFLTSVLILKLLLKINYDFKISFATTMLFTVLSCHGNVIFSINSLNILISTILILSGLYLFSISQKKLILICVSFLFLLALLSRESAFCYFPLVLLINKKIQKLTWKEVIITLVVPLITYILLKTFSYPNHPQSIKESYFEILANSPFQIIYNLLYFILSPILPIKYWIVKTIDIQNLNFLREIILNPSKNFLFSVSLIFLSLMFIIIIIYLFSILRNEIKFPLIFVISAAISYLPLNIIAERFLYVPSLGICLLISILIFKCKYFGFKSKITILLLLSSVHFYTLYKISNDYKIISNIHIELLNKIAAATYKVPPNSNVLLENVPTTYDGTILIVQQNINDMWRYHTSNHDYNFWLYIPQDSTIQIDTTLEIK